MIEYSIRNKEAIKESIEIIPEKINLYIKGGKYIFPYTKLSTLEQSKIPLKVIPKELQLEKQISTLGNLHTGIFNIEIEEFKGKNKKVQIIYAITKDNNTYCLNLYKNFGGDEFDVVNIYYKKGEIISKEIEFKRKGKGGFDKDLNNLTLKIELKT